MIYNIAIDADSLVYKSCYRHQLTDKKDIKYTREEKLKSFNLELAYFEFCQEIGKIRSAPFAGNEPLLTYEKGDDVNVLIVLSPKKSFRNDIYPEYKANRKENNIVGIKELKILILRRLKDWVLLVQNVEADDVVNYYAREHNYMVSAIDKDVINANPTFTYNYNSFKWYQPKSEYEIEKWYLYQTLLGDRTDNIPGAKGVGEVGAKKIVDNIDSLTLENIEEHFDTPMDAQMNHWLVRMDMWDGKELILKKEDTQ